MKTVDGDSTFVAKKQRCTKRQHFRSNNNSSSGECTHTPHGQRNGTHGEDDGQLVASVLDIEYKHLLRVKHSSVISTRKYHNAAPGSGHMCFNETTCNHNDSKRQEVPCGISSLSKLVQRARTPEVLDVWWDIAPLLVHNGKRAWIVRRFEDDAHHHLRLVCDEHNFNDHVVVTTAMTLITGMGLMVNWGATTTGYPTVQRDPFASVECILCLDGIVRNTNRRRGTVIAAALTTLILSGNWQLALNICIHLIEHKMNNVDNDDKTDWNITAKMANSRLFRQGRHNTSHVFICMSKLAYALCHWGRPPLDKNISCICNENDKCACGVSMVHIRGKTVTHGVCALRCLDAGRGCDWSVVWPGTTYCHIP